MSEPTSVPRAPLRATSPTDLLALVPCLLGFHPEDSVVLLTVGPASTPFHARVDLPADPLGVEEVAAHLAGVARRHEASRIALLVHGDDTGLAEALVDQVAGRLRGSGTDLVCAVRADGERWWALDADGEVEGEGTPYDVRSHPWATQAVVDGRVVLGSRQALAESLVGTDLEEATRIREIAEEIAAGRAMDRAHLVLQGRWVRHRVRRFLVDAARLDTHDVARLTAAMSSSLEVRDVAWAEMTRENAVAHVDLWRDLVRRAPLDLCAAPAALLGFAGWLSGDGAMAWCAVDRAQQAEAGYGLARLLTQVLTGAVPPSAWRPLPSEALTLFAG